ncbi:MAG: elongation factor P [Elusimicrobiales bacterium]|jgi:elongation factor P|nr:elongation factor P [Elusimicrobiales bacterium]HOJ86288.1 elongation factor P [Elusimicrobiales bacterium]HOL62978.1 elongation factor P [Elusimicrobiales bacterium]HPO95437.1 elongation factor P [Elusimicrobiales bacterium]
MITAVEFKEGTIFVNENNEIVQVLTYQHHRKSQAKAVVRVKLRNLETGSVIETSYRPEDKFKDVLVEKRPKVYMYSDSTTAYFMDTQNYEQVGVPLEKLGDQVKLLVENMEVEGLYLNDKFFNIILPASVVLEVVETVPGVKGDSVSNMMKPAKLSSGIEIKVPLFVNAGDKVKVDTRTLEYVERV